MHLDLRQSLLKWYHTYKRCLPWRQSAVFVNPYHVMVSEFMLQQTTVQTVIPYFERFMQRFPTLKDLGESTLDDVYRLWQGLGYYSRAKNLHSTACQIMDLGYFPNTPQGLCTLKGVGDYTSAAVASIAFEYPIIPIDGNVMRIMSRLFLLDEPKGPILHKVIKSYLPYFEGEHDHGDFAQSLMDLGAMICKPKNPLCEDCPLNYACAAYKKGIPDLYPKKSLKPIKPKRQGNIYIITKPGSVDHVLLVKRKTKGLFAHMYTFPTDFLDEQLWNDLKDGISCYYTCPTPVRHIFTHFDLTATIVLANVFVEDFDLSSDTVYVWANINNFNEYALPTLMKKALSVVKFYEKL